MTPADTLSNKQISLIADEIDEGKLREIAIQYFGLSFFDLAETIMLQEQNRLCSWLRNSLVIEIWREKNPAEHHATVRIICKNTGFQFLEHATLSYILYIFYHYVHQRLAYLLYKAADEHGWINPEMVQDVLGISRKEAEEFCAKEKPSDSSSG